MIQLGMVVSVFPKKDSQRFLSFPFHFYEEIQFFKDGTKLNPQAAQIFILFSMQMNSVFLSAKFSNFGSEGMFLIVFDNILEALHWKFD